MYVLAFLFMFEKDLEVSVTVLPYHVFLSFLKTYLLLFFKVYPIYNKFYLLSPLITMFCIPVKPIFVTI